MKFLEFLTYTGAIFLIFYISFSTIHPPGRSISSELFDEIIKDLVPKKIYINTLEGLEYLNFQHDDILGEKISDATELEITSRETDIYYIEYTRICHFNSLNCLSSKEKIIPLISKGDFKVYKIKD